jgi:hypothetical protein
MTEEELKAYVASLPVDEEELSAMERAQIADGQDDLSIEHLADLLTTASAKVTFDLGRNNTHACTFCGQRPADRGLAAFRLVTIGRYFSGEFLTRPVCAGCLDNNRSRVEQ